MLGFLGHDGPFSFSGKVREASEVARCHARGRKEGGFTFSRVRRRAGWWFWVPTGIQEAQDSGYMKTKGRRKEGVSKISEERWWRILRSSLLCVDSNLNMVRTHARTHTPTHTPGCGVREDQLLLDDENVSFKENC